MKKYFYFLSVILSMAMVFPLVSCGGDDDDEDGVPDSKFSYVTCPDNKHPHKIDLGLPSGTLWACCNVGATTPEGFGGYYAWGEKDTKEKYDSETYILRGPGYYQEIGSEISGTEFDVAHAKWGGSWVMPSLKDGDELYECCTREKTTENGVEGYRLHGPSGGSIFLPAAGYRTSDYVRDLGKYCYYWSSTLTNRQYLFVKDAYTISSGEYDRALGFPVRPVSK